MPFYRIFLLCPAFNNKQSISSKFMNGVSFQISTIHLNCHGQPNISAELMNFYYFSD